MVNVDNEVEAWWSKEWGMDELEEEALAAPSLWEAELVALSDEQLAALEASEDF